MSQDPTPTPVPVPALLLVVGLIGLGGAAFYFMNGADAAPQESDKTFVPADVAGSTPKTASADAPAVRRTKISREEVRSQVSPTKAGEKMAPKVDTEGLKRALSTSKLQNGPAANVANRAAGRAAIKDAVAQMKPELKSCYDDLRGEFPDAEGKVSVSMTLVASGRQGTVSEIKIGEGTDLFEERLHACMKDSLSQISFPFEREDGVIQVRYPFTFHAP